MSAPGTIKIKELQSQQLQFTKDAKCQMQCGNISEEEIKQVLKGGAITYGKSNPQAKPCPLYSIEGSTESGKSLEFISSDCDSTTFIIKVIDSTGKKNSCACN